MKIKINKRYLWIGLVAFLVIAASICFYYLIFHGDVFSSKIRALFAIASPVIYGIIFSYLMTPMVNSIEAKLLVPLFTLKHKELTKKRRKYMRVVSILITIIIVILLIYGFFSILIPNIFKSIRSISYQFPYYVQNLTTWSSDFLDNNPDIERVVSRVLDTYSEEFTNYLDENIIPRMESLLRQVSLSMIGFLKVLWNFIIGFIISIYVLYSKETFAGQSKKIMFAFLNTSMANQFIKDVRFTSDTFIGFIGGKIIDSFIIGCICFAGTSIMKMPYALLISVIVGVTNIIPFFGPYLGAIPSAILILMVNPVKCIYFIIFILILQQVDGNLIGPKILGESTGLSGFWVIFSITIFGGLMGIPGMIIGVPLFAVFYALVRRRADKMLQNRGLPIETEQYMNVESIENTGFVQQSTDSKSMFFKRKNKKSSENANENTSENTSKNTSANNSDKTSSVEGESAVDVNKESL